jgi:nucleoside-diphosphate kinase
MCRLSKPEAEHFYAVHRGKPFFSKLVDFMTSGRLVAMELVAPDAIQKWRDLIGPTDSAAARMHAPRSLRALFGTDNTLNACHGSDAVETAAAELAFFFGGKEVGRCVVGRGTTLGVIKPHLVTHGVAGLVLDVVQDQFDITALQQFKLDKAAAAEFLEVYKGVVAPGEFHAMVEELTSGPCIALEVADRDGADPVEAFRELCGPMDPEISRALRPQSIRAQFGLSRVRNGIHCTDLPEDGELEVGFFFEILQRP